MPFEENANNLFSCNDKGCLPDTGTIAVADAAVYGVEIPNIAYHLRKIFEDAELDKNAVIKDFLITAPDGKNYRVNHYNL